jgi:hypothetical protein
LFRIEITPVVLKDKHVVVNANRRRFCARVIGILQQFGDDVPWTLNLTEKLMPRPGKVRVTLQLIPTLGRATLDVVEVVWRLHGRSVI